MDTEHVLDSGITLREMGFVGGRTNQWRREQQQINYPNL